METFMAEYAGWVHAQYGGKAHMCVQEPGQTVVVPGFMAHTVRGWAGLLPVVVYVYSWTGCSVLRLHKVNRVQVKRC